MASDLAQNTTAAHIVNSILETTKKEPIVVVGRSTCEHTTGARSLLDQLKLGHKDIDIDRFDAFEETKQLLAKQTEGHHTTPWIFVDSHFLGGESDLRSAIAEAAPTGKIEDVIAEREKKSIKAKEALSKAAAKKGKEMGSAGAA